MNVFHKTTLETLRKNRIRTIVTILGVVLSAAMVCAVTTIVVSFQGFYREDTVYSTGEWYGRVSGGDAAIRETLAADSRVRHVASAQILGYAQSDSRNEDKPYIYLMGADETFFSTMSIHYTGRLPERAGEVLAPEHYMDRFNGEVSLKVGDTISLNLGDRMIDGYVLDQTNPYVPEETLETRKAAQYTVVGFYERPDFEDYSAPGYTFLTVPEEDGPQCYDLYFSTENPADADAVLEDYDLPCDVNWELLHAEGIVQYDNFGRVMVHFAAILIFLIALGSISLIYSAFSISVSERTRQFGLLRSVGATRKQLRRSVFFEAAVISAVGIPLGIAGGIGGIAVTLHFIGGLFKTVVSSEVPMRLRVSWVSVGIAAAVAIITVAVSVWIPALRANRVTAMEAIRQSRDVSTRGKDVRVSRLAWKLFGLEGALARKYYRRSRKRYRATVVSLVLSVTLFISASAFGMYLTGTVGDTVTYSNYDIACALGDMPPEEVFPALMEAKGVTEGCYLTDLGGSLLVYPEQLTQEYRDFMLSPYGEWPSDLLENLDGPLVLDAHIWYVDETTYRAYLQKLGLDENLYLDSEAPLPLVYAPSTFVTYTGNQRFTQNIEILRPEVTEVESRKEQTVDGYEYWYTDYQLQEDGRYRVEDCFGDPHTGETVLKSTLPQALALGQRVMELPMGVTASDKMVDLLYPYSAAPEVHYTVARFCSDDHEATATALKEILLARGCYSGSDQVLDIRHYESSDRNLVTIVNVFTYGFIILISLIAVANVFNTISTNVALRRREFAVLRSIGMTRSGLSRMMNYECLLYGFRALLYGLPLSALMTFWIYRATRATVDSRFQLPWTAVAIAVCSVFAVVFVTMLYAMRKIKKENPIDALKNENI